MTVTSVSFFSPPMSFIWSIGSFLPSAFGKQISLIPMVISPVPLLSAQSGGLFDLSRKPKSQPRFQNRMPKERDAKVTRIAIEERVSTCIIS